VTAVTETVINVKKDMEHIKMQVDKLERGQEGLKSEVKKISSILDMLTQLRYSKPPN